MRAPPKCAKCAGPGRQTLYRKVLPSNVPESRCNPRGRGGLWAIPCCPLHYTALSRCSQSGCISEGNKGGRCWTHYQRGNPPLPVCIRCRGELNLAYCRGSRALCRACTNAVEAEGESGAWAMIAQALRDGKGGTVKRLVRLHGLELVASGIGASPNDTALMASGHKPVPGPTWARCLTMLRGDEDGN